jgi:hypothetical protein
MDFRTLHLERSVALPENYRDTIFDRKVLAIFDTTETTPEKERLQERGFYGTRGSDGKQDVYLNLTIEGIWAFRMRVKPNYRDPNDRTLWYQLELSLKRPEFAPFYNYIDRWGRKNSRGSISLNCYFADWLLKHIGQYDKQREGFALNVDPNGDNVNFEVTDEAAYMRLLAEVSSAFRKLATKTAKWQWLPLKKRDSYGNYGINAIRSYRRKDFEGICEEDLIELIMMPAIGTGLNEGLEKFRVNRREGDAGRTISIRLDVGRKSMLFYENDSCEGRAFFEFKMGAILPECLSAINKKGLAYEDEVGRWFKEAALYAGNIYKTMGLTVKIPEAGNPALKHFEG